MAKTPKVKKRSVSIHSRAARRATSPSLNLDKSLKEIRAPVEDEDRRPSGRPYSVLGVHGTPGITKKRKAKHLSRAQRIRQEKGVERAHNVADNLEKKLQQSMGRLKTVKTRRGDWDDLNAKIEKEDGDVTVHNGGVKSNNPFEGLKRDEGREWMPLPEPGEELVLPLMMGRPPPSRGLKKPEPPRQASKEHSEIPDVT